MSPVSRGDHDEGGQLRAQLLAFGANPGPITNSTKAVYLRLLARLQANGPLVLSTPLISSPTLEGSPAGILSPSAYYAELEAAIINPSSVVAYTEFEAAIRDDFDAPARQWRSGTSKISFNYLLLDGRITQNLPLRAATIVDASEITRQFLAAVFYIGKGQAGRPYAHLNEAIQAWQRHLVPKDPKESVILDIWRAGAGVVCIPVFHNTITVEALTREAAMIDAIGRQHLRNLRRGEYYGQAAEWSSEKQRKLGVLLLFKAKDIFLRDGERPIHPYDL